MNQEISEIVTLPNNGGNQQSMINKSSMLTYSKIVCCLCSAVIDATPSAICETCSLKNLNLNNNLDKEYIINYCQRCDRYNRPPWLKTDLESPEMMNWCLSKIKNWKQIKIIDSSFIYTEPHSKRIKIKWTVQKEIDKKLISQNLIIEYIVEWTQCHDCKKSFTPHLWWACVQIRHKTMSKQVLLYLEQIIWKNKMHAKAIEIKEMPEGVDFFFPDRNSAERFAEFIGKSIPIKLKHSSHYVSWTTMEHTYCCEIAPVLKNDWIIWDKNISKSLGGIGPVVWCDRISAKIRIKDPWTFEQVEVDTTSYWRYQFQAFHNYHNCEISCLTEFLILNCEEDNDYHYHKNKDTSSTGKVFNIKCIRNNHSSLDVIDVKACFNKMKAGDIYWGYDWKFGDFGWDWYSLDVILVKRKPEKERKIRLKRWKIEHEGNEGKKRGKKVMKIMMKRSTNISSMTSRIIRIWWKMLLLIQGKLNEKNKRQLSKSSFKKWYKEIKYKTRV